MFQVPVKFTWTQMRQMKGDNAIMRHTTVQQCIKRKATIIQQCTVQQCVSYMCDKTPCNQHTVA